MIQRIICVIAGQRAGTTALRQAIGLAGGARDYGEIFQTRANDENGMRHAFWTFAHENGIALSTTMMPDGAAMVARQYVERLKMGAGAKHVLIDVKLNSWWALSPAWQYPHDEPFLLKWLKREKTAFIFLWRKNLAEQVLSLYIANELGRWHNITAESVAGRTFRAPIGQLERWAGLICRSESDMREHLKKYPEKIVAAYEELYRDGALSNAFKAEFCTLTGVDLSGRQPRMRQNQVRKRDVVSNYEEAVAAISAIAAKYRSGTIEQSRRAVEP
jgi:LPS sulfotransferase NodH